MMINNPGIYMWWSTSCYGNDPNTITGRRINPTTGNTEYLIYIGKSKDIKTRVNKHTSGNVNNSSIRKHLNEMGYDEQREIDGWELDVIYCDDYSRIERQMIEAFQPPLNRQHVTSTHHMDIQR